MVSWVLVVIDGDVRRGAPCIAARRREIMGAPRPPNGEPARDMGAVAKG
jgi:hypothetical protein